MSKSEKLLKEINIYIVEILFTIAYGISELKSIFTISLSLIFCTIALIIFTILFIIKMIFIKKNYNKDINQKYNKPVKTTDKNDEYYDDFRGYRP